MKKAYYYGRFSSSRQASSTSYERQLDLPRQWCEQKKVTLDETLSYFDKAKSGYHGSHRKAGAGLDLFIKACEQKKIPEGSYLLVESLDRLSREQLHVFQDLVRDILFEFKIKIVVLFGNIEFTAENFEVTHWLLDAEAQRAHSESRTKSYRGLDRWERRRASGKHMPVKTPAWIKIVDGKPELDKVKAKTVKRIFELASTGHGYASICRVLTTEGHKPIASRPWYPSYVKLIVANRAAIGEFTPMKFEDGKRVVAGPPRQGYYPAAVSVDLFTKAQRATTSRPMPTGNGREAVPNLFTGLVFWKDQPMMVSKNNYITHNNYYAGVRRDHLERVILAFLSEAKINLRNQQDTTDLRNRADELLEPIP